MSDKKFEIIGEEISSKKFDIKSTNEVNTPIYGGGNPTVNLYSDMYAGFWKRACACFIDGLITTVLAVIAGFICGFLYGASGGNIDGAELIGGIAGILIVWIYYAAFESSARQATPGKMALGIIVTDYYGKRIGFGKATGRYFGKIISMLLLYIGFIMAAFTRRKQGLHDMMSGCLVVNR